MNCYSWLMTKPRKTDTPEAFERVLKRMLQTPPTPHAEGRGNGKKKSAGGPKRKK